jgi:hypothetical protein
VEGDVQKFAYLHLVSETGGGMMITLATHHEHHTDPNKNNNKIVGKAKKP